jgi:hypothetical protein
MNDVCGPGWGAICISAKRKFPLLEKILEKNFRKIARNEISKGGVFSKPEIAPKNFSRRAAFCALQCKYYLFQSVFKLLASPSIKRGAMQLFLLMLRCVIRLVLKQCILFLTNLFTWYHWRFAAIAWYRYDNARAIV